ncbi:hypothetical protein [Croceicoccus marinus]|uniref:Uncharacterized protein n=1 Tax=Croceicoccus marinus TaxID=450378 RepID=A0A7G6VYM7_9SPHN|nr:hypothetical protein [Croceicoccus marinus]QNE06842.1 hypothetical protein H4O24_17335 [Croceicoccus marinus]
MPAASGVGLSNPWSSFDLRRLNIVNKKHIDQIVAFDLLVGSYPPVETYRHCEKWVAPGREIILARLN